MRSPLNPSSPPSGVSAEIRALPLTDRQATGAGKHNFRIPLIGLLAAAVCTFVVGFWLWGSETASKIVPATFITAQSQALTMTVVGRGTIEPARVVPVQSPIESNRARIVWLVPEGRAVDAGELIARFDKRPFKEALELAKQRTVETQANVVRAEKALALALEETDAADEAAQRQLEVAEIERDDARHGGGLLEFKRLRHALAKAERAVTITAVENTDYQELFEQGHISRKELAVAVDAHRSALDTLSLAQDELDGFEKFDWPRRKREADLAWDAAKTEVARVKRTASLEQQRLEANLEKATKEATLAEQMLEKASRELAQSDIRAPIGGTVLYTDIPKSGGERRKVQVGDALWLGQTFMKIPDTSDLDVSLEVREFDVAKLVTGQTAHIELDAFRHRLETGKVTQVASIAEPSADGTKRFRVEVRFDQPPQSAHVGMSANVTIVHGEHHANIAVPIGALQHHAGTTRVQLASGDSQPVSVGQTDGRWAEIVTGLSAGAEVAVF